MKIFFEVFLIVRLTKTPKTSSRRRQRRKDSKNDAKMAQNDPKTIENDLKIARKRSENCTLSAGRIDSDIRIVFKFSD